jgi:hypothetical protein
MIKAIPTKYNGTQFRSRLEARWAAFFDLLGWPWEYEPFDCDGWIPDFALFGAEQQMLVEVKPIFYLMPDIIAEMERVKPAGTYAMMLAGSTIEDNGITAGTGWLRCFEPRTHPHWMPRTIWQHAMDKAKFDIIIESVHEDSNPSGFFTREHFRTGVENNWDIYAGDHVVGLWREAGNRVQWRKK